MEEMKIGSIIVRRVKGTKPFQAFMEGSGTYADGYSAEEALGALIIKLHKNGWITDLLSVPSRKQHKPIIRDIDGILIDENDPIRPDRYRGSTIQ
jgi:hypothetical protein